MNHLMSERGRTRRHIGDPLRYTAYDLVTARPHDTIDIVTLDPDSGLETDLLTLTKREMPKGTSALDGWILENEMGRATVTLLLLERSKGGGPTALHGRVVLREGRELGAIGIGDSDTKPDRIAAPATVHNLGTIALMSERLTAEQYDMARLWANAAREYAI